MNEVVKNLLELQRLDIRIEVLRGFLDARPGLRDELAGERRAAEDDIADKRGQLEEAKQELRGKERALADGEDKLKQIHVKLNAVKSNKEYEAALKEIEDQKAVNGRAEEQILLLYDKVEEAGQAKKKLEEKWDALAAEFDRRGQELSAKAEAAETELAGLRKQRDELAAGIAPADLAHYDKVRNKSGRAVARAEGEICRGCHCRIPAQLYNEVLKGEQLIPCNNCSRILVHTDIEIDDGLMEF